MVTNTLNNMALSKTRPHFHLHEFRLHIRYGSKKNKVYLVDGIKNKKQTVTLLNLLNS